jgi:hypothetical protein
MYSLDTNVFVDWQARYYPLDVFTSLSTKIEELIASGECAAVRLVKQREAEAAKGPLHP